MIDKNTHHNSLDLFFISPKYHGDGLGLATWKTIEKNIPIQSHGEQLRHILNKEIYIFI